MSKNNGLVDEYTEFFKKFKKVVILRDEQCLEVNTTGRYTYTGEDGSSVLVEKDDDTLYVSQNYGFLWLLQRMFPYLEYADDVISFLKTKHLGSLNAVAIKPLHKVWKYYVEETSRVNVRKSYVVVRGILPQGKYVSKSANCKALFINGTNVLVEGVYDCPAYEDGSGQLVTLVYEQTDYDLANNLTGQLVVNHTDCPLENMEIFVHIGTDTHLQPEIEDLLTYDTAKTFYCDGNWIWSCLIPSPITELYCYGVFSVKSGATYNVPGLMKLVIPNSCNAYSSAGGKSALRWVDISHLMGNIADSAFSGSQLRNSLIDGVETNKFIINNAGSIGQSAFYGCTNLATVDIGDSVTSIGPNAFYGCTNLATVDIGDSVTSIGQYAFYGCTNLATVDIGDSVTSIGTSAFYGCTNLTTVDIGYGVRSIDAAAFNGCSNLRNVTVPVGYNCASNQFKQANISDESMRAIIANCADRTGSAVGYWYVSSAALANMSAETLSAATAKNWNIRT